MILVVLLKVSLFSWQPFYNFRSLNWTLKKLILEHCDDDVDDYDSGGDADINHGDNSDENGDDDNDDDDETNGNKLLSLYYYESDNDNSVVYQMITHA